jgi:hypothetical protein
MSTLDEIGRFLNDDTVYNNGVFKMASQGAATPNLFLSGWRDSPDLALVLYQYAGQQPMYMMGGGVQSIEYPRLQLVVRAAQYQDAMDWAYKFWKLLGTIGNQTLSGTKWLRVMALDGPQSLTPDDKNRQRIAANFEVTKELS